MDCLPPATVPEEAFKALNGHIYLSLIVAAATVLTVFVISASYSQIIELFPSGGGGYLVAKNCFPPPWVWFPVRRC